jgi:hypothetical protein
MSDHMHALKFRCSLLLSRVTRGRWVANCGMLDGWYFS